MKDSVSALPSSCTRASAGLAFIGARAERCERGARAVAMFSGRRVVGIGLVGLVLVPGPLFVTACCLSPYSLLLTSSRAGPELPCPVDRCRAIRPRPATWLRWRVCCTCPGGRGGRRTLSSPPLPSLPNPRMWRSRVVAGRVPVASRVRVVRVCASVSLLLTPYPVIAQRYTGTGQSGRIQSPPMCECTAWAWTTLVRQPAHIEARLQAHNATG